MMVHRPRVAVLTGFGINCDRETESVFEMVDAQADRIHLNRLCRGDVSLDDYHILAIPGGFSFGDHLGSGRLFGNRLRFTLRDELQAFVASGRPVIGICNGFQVLVKTGLLPGSESFDMEQTASITLNDSGRFEDRWVTIDFDPESPCIWTTGVERMEAPIRHGEGKFVVPDKDKLDAYCAAGLAVCRYVDPQTKIGQGLTDKPLPYPICPNGSMRNIAGICDSSGLVFGLMPHPEAYHSIWLHPRWTNQPRPDIKSDPSLFAILAATSGSDSELVQQTARIRSAEREAWEGPGLQIFTNAVAYIRQQTN